MGNVVWPDWSLSPMPTKKLLTEAEAHALILKESGYRQGCADFAPVFTLRRTEPDNEALE